MIAPAIDAAHRCRPTITWASDWTRVTPVNRFVACPDCGGLRYANTGPHAPRWLEGRLVDCCGRTIDAAGGAR